MPPDPRYNHAMVSVQNGQQVFLFGGFRGDGTRLEDVFLLDLATPVDGADVGSDEEEKEDGVDDEDVQVGALVLPEAYDLFQICELGLGWVGLGWVLFWLGWGWGTVGWGTAAWVVVGWVVILGGWVSVGAWVGTRFASVMCIFVVL